MGCSEVLTSRYLQGWRGAVRPLCLIRTLGPSWGQCKAASPLCAPVHRIIWGDFKGCQGCQAGQCIRVSEEPYLGRTFIAILLIMN